MKWVFRLIWLGWTYNSVNMGNKSRKCLCFDWLYTSKWNRSKAALHSQRINHIRIQMGNMRRTFMSRTSKECQTKNNKGWVCQRTNELRRIPNNPDGLISNILCSFKRNPKNIRTNFTYRIYMHRRMHSNHKLNPY